MRGKIIGLLILAVLSLNLVVIIIETPSNVSAFTPHDPIKIEGDLDFAAHARSENWSGNGTSEDPYVIKGIEITGDNEIEIVLIDIRSTSVHFIIRNSSLDGQWLTTNINLYNVSNAKVEDCIIRNGSFGIDISKGKHNEFVNNTFIDNDVHLWETENNTFSQNRFTNSAFVLEGNKLRFWNSHTINSSNIINGKPLYYFKEQKGGSVPPDCGSVILVNCSDFVIENLRPEIGSYGINLAFSSQNILRNNTITSQNQAGINLYHSSENEIIHNTITQSDHGIRLEHSDNNSIMYNMLTVNSNGISLIHSNSNLVAQNNVSKGIGSGIYCGSPRGHFSTYGNVIINNSIDNFGSLGLEIEFSNGLLVTGNNISNNLVGISLELTNGSFIYGNLFMGNNQQLKMRDSFNTWQNSSNAGNFWSDYNGSDTNKDGIGDSNLPHQGVDFYPLMDNLIFGNNETKSENNEEDYGISDISDPCFLGMVLILIVTVSVVLLLIWELKEYLRRSGRSYDKNQQSDRGPKNDENKEPEKMEDDLLIEDEKP